MVLTNGFGLQGSLLPSSQTSMFGKKFTNPVKRVELKFNGKEETLRPDWMEDSRHGEGKSDNKGEL